MPEKKYLDIIVCPLCKGSLHYKVKQQELICKFDKIAFPIKDDIPVMLELEARKINQDESL